MEVTRFEDLKDRHLGKVGTTRRDAYEARLEQEMNEYFIGEALKTAREAQNLTQEQLAEKMGVKKTQVWRLEHGKNPTMASVDRALRALGLSGSLNFGTYMVKLGI